MSGGFFGQSVVNLLGRRGFFGIPRLIPAVSGFSTEAGPINLQLPTFPGASGLGDVTGWFGANDGNLGVQTLGSTVSVVTPGVSSWGPTPPYAGSFGFGDCSAIIRDGIPGLPGFVAYNDNVGNQNDFATLTLNGKTYTTAAVDAFDNGGGCGPTYWIWTTVGPAGLIIANSYPVVLT